MSVTVGETKMSVALDDLPLVKFDEFGASVSDGFDLDDLDMAAGNSTVSILCGTGASSTSGSCSTSVCGCGGE